MHATFRQRLESRRYCPNCEAEFMSEKTIMYYNNFLKCEIHYVCGTIATWDIDIRDSVIEYKKNCKENEEFIDG